MRVSALVFVGVVLLPGMSLASGQTPDPQRQARQDGAALPDSPGAAVSGVPGPQATVQRQPCAVAPSGKPPANGVTATVQAANPTDTVPCPHENIYHRFLDDATPAPLTSKEKAVLAGRNIVDPFNLLTIVGNSAIYIGANSHTPYGPAWKGFGYNVGVSLLQDATGEVVGTYMLCSLFHQDPHYHRMPQANPARRALHAVLHTVVAPSDTGRSMPNMENFLGYPITAAIANLYVPGLQTNVPSTTDRVLTGLATDPIGNLITEFLPDFAKRIHVKVVFVQRIINQVATGSGDGIPEP